MTNEYSVACLLDESSTAALTQRVSFLDDDNCPHISLFQFRTDDESFLARIKQELDKLVMAEYFFTDSIKQVEENVFLDIYDDGSLKAASERLTDVYHAECLHKEPLSQIDFTCISEEQRLLVRQYGNYWIRQNFRPHVTLLYNNKTCHHDLVSPPVAVKLLSAGVYPIDSMGRIQHVNPFSWKEMVRNEPITHYINHR